LKRDGSANANADGTKANGGGGGGWHTQLIRWNGER
jgi:hypothetical protein